MSAVEIKHLDNCVEMFCRGAIALEIAYSCSGPNVYLTQQQNRALLSAIAKIALIIKGSV